MVVEGTVAGVVGTAAAGTAGALADMAQALAGIAAAVGCIPSARRISAGRTLAARILRLIQSEAAVSRAVRHESTGRASADRVLRLGQSEVAVRRRGLAAPPHRPARLELLVRTRATRLPGYSAIAQSPTWALRSQFGAAQRMLRPFCASAMMRSDIMPERDTCHG